MVVFVRKLKKAERLELSRLLHSREDGRVVRRVQMILQSSQGIKVPAIASAWDTTIQTVLKTIHRFNAEGLASLVDKPRSGRPPKATDQYVEVLKEAVQRSPRDLGYVFLKANIVRPFEEAQLEDLRQISEQHQNAFEKSETEFQNYQNIPGIKPQPMKPKRVLNEF